jgi:uncharacterized membrane protein YgcG
MWGVLQEELLMRHITFPLMALAIVAMAASSQAFAASEVKDDAHFFSPEAVTAANSRLKALEQKYRRSVMIETLADIPADKRSGYTAERKNQFYAGWLKERAQANKVDGLYVLITREPAHLQVGIGQQLQRMGFTNDDRDRVRDALSTAFKRKQYDDGLSDAINAIATTLDEKSKTFSTGATNAPTQRGSTTATPMPTTGATPTSKTPGWTWFTWLLVIGGGLLLLRLVMSAFRRPAPVYTGSASGQVPYGGGTQPGYGPGPGGAGGGGFMSGMLGGLLGGAAGNWAANRWFGHGEEPRRPDSLPPQGPDAGLDNSTGADFGGPGGDVGGGADFGGSDSGGGGDSGGGSDF